MCQNQYKKCILYVFLIRHLTCSDVINPAHLAVHVSQTNAHRYRESLFEPGVLAITISKNVQTHTQRKMCGHTAEDERRQEGERHDEGVEEAVVAFSHTVPYPWAVMVESLCERNAPNAFTSRVLQQVLRSQYSNESGLQ